MEIKGTFLFLLFGLSFNSLTQSIARDSGTDTSHKPVSMTIRVPHPGIYAVSVVDKDVVNADTLQPNIADYMLDNSAMLKDVNDTSAQQFGFETQQIISGKVKRALLKVKNPQIITLNPATGERQSYSLDHHQSFNLIGYDIQEGGTLLVQATKENGKDNLVELEIKEPYYPTLSFAELLKVQDTLSLPPINEQKLTKSSETTQEKYFKEVMLDEVVTTGERLIKPLNKYGFMPYRGFTYNDPEIANANTMDEIIARVGLLNRTFGGNKVIGLYRSRNTAMGGRECGFFFPSIYIDGVEINTFDEMWELSPKDITQIEYFTGDQAEVEQTLHSTPAGVLCIFTKPNRPRRNPISMQVVNPLGYRPAKKAYNPLNDPNYTASKDYRATLLWNPELVVDSTCKAHITFMPSSTSQHYTINIEGISNDGDIACSNSHHSTMKALTNEQESTITKYLEDVPREKVYIQTDRNQYCAGDTVWFRVHIADALSNIPSTSPNYPTDRSKFAYVEFHGNLTPNKKKVTDTLIERIMIKEDSLGVFASYIVLPLSLPTGNYTFVTYTRHELNFSEDELFTKLIQVQKASIPEKKKE